ncbi:unnamed protein product, partial [Didymodactylos carnosus]
PFKILDRVVCFNNRSIIEPEDARTVDLPTSTTTGIPDQIDNVPRLLDEVILKQNNRKQQELAKISQWNEGLTQTVTAQAYIGLFYAWPNHKANCERVYPTWKLRKIAKV